MFSSSISPSTVAMSDFNTIHRPLEHTGTPAPYSVPPNRQLRVAEARLARLRKLRAYVCYPVFALAMLIYFVNVVLFEPEARWAATGFMVLVSVCLTIVNFKVHKLHSHVMQLQVESLGDD